MVKMRSVNLFLKRLGDIILSSVGIALLILPFILIAVAIKVSSKGPVLFKQERLGRNGKIFKIIKFRTMVVNAEHIGEGLRVSSENDIRITRVGKLLRKTSLDELPQLFNVFCGSMSLIGPRPPVTYHPYNGYENYPEEFKNRFKMRPGVTGLAQVRVRNSATWDERIEIDLEYVFKFNIFLDIKILFLTFIGLFKPQHIYNEKPQQAEVAAAEDSLEEELNDDR